MPGARRQSGVEARALNPSLARLQEDLEALARFREPNAPGWTRRVFSQADLQAREWLRDRMAEAGLEVHQDAAANLIGILHGAAGPGPAIVTGSHVDTVYGGGRFDGTVGVLGALEAVRCIREGRIGPTHDVVVVAFLGEEANDFGISCVGSRAVAGNLTAEHLSLRDGSGRTLGEALGGAGGDPGRIESAGWEPARLLGYVELHVEQGPVLDDGGLSLGVVTGIAGIHRLTLEFTGRPDHSGTTPMDRRRDALAAAAETLVGIEELAREGGGVATTGRLESSPQALNVVPGWARIWAEFRSSEATWLDKGVARVTEIATRAGRRRGVGVFAERLSAEPPLDVPGSVQRTIEGAIDDLSVRWMGLPSGAGHDAVQMSQLGPAGMIFIPSRGGRSHCPEEWTDPEHIRTGVQALAATIVHLDRAEADARGS